MSIDFEMCTFAEQFMLLVSTVSCSHCINDTVAGGNYCSTKRFYAELFYQAQMIVEHCQVSMPKSPVS